jgi:hypothetical protein
MNSLAYLLRKSLKNGFFEILRKPSKLILYLILIAVLAGLMLSSSFGEQEAKEFLDPVWLKGVFFLLALVLVLSAVRSGLSGGDAIFGMSDVNLLFVSPVDSRAILIYGLARMARTALLASFVLLFQGATLRSAFGMGFGALLLILLGFMLALVLTTALSFLIYSLTNGKPARKRAVKLIAAAAFLPLALCCAARLMQAGLSWGALEGVLRSPFFSWTPIAGWAAEGALSLIGGGTVKGLLFFGLILLAIGAVFFYIAVSHPDYYEDALVATETAFEKTRAMAEGQINLEGTSRKNFKLAGTGVGGFGANAFFYKHLRESFRANRLGLWGLPSVLTLAGAVAVAFFVGELRGILIILQILMWMQIFLIGTGRGLKELYSHYIYMIPESSFSKIVWSNLEIVFKVLVESLLIFGLSGALLGVGVPLAAAAIAVYTLFSLLLLGINYLSLRWIGADISAGLLIFFYTFAVLLVMLPGLGLAILASAALGGGMAAGFAVLAAWELIAGLACFALSRGILHRCDMPSVPLKK